jgi:hypothetical protein
MGGWFHKYYFTLACLFLKIWYNKVEPLLKGHEMTRDHILYAMAIAGLATPLKWLGRDMVDYRKASELVVHSTPLGCALFGIFKDEVYIFGASASGGHIIKFYQAAKAEAKKRELSILSCHSHTRVAKHLQTYYGAEIKEVSLNRYYITLRV